ncbi:unnamed protein product [Rhodiola kirilowii]
MCVYSCFFLWLQGPWIPAWSSPPAMVHESISSPHRKTGAFSSPTYKRQFQARDELGNCSTLLKRHRFLLTALSLLVVLCTVYLYFAITLGASSCAGMKGNEKALCHLKHSKTSVSHGKLKFL